MAVRPISILCTDWPDKALAQVRRPRIQRQAQVNCAARHGRPTLDTRNYCRHRAHCRHERKNRVPAPPTTCELAGSATRESRESLDLAAGGRGLVPRGASYRRNAK